MIMAKHGDVVLNGTPTDLMADTICILKAIEKEGLPAKEIVEAAFKGEFDEAFKDMRTIDLKEGM